MYIVGVLLYCNYSLYFLIILCRSGQESHLQECLVYRPDCLTENLSWKRFFSEKDVHEAIEKHLEEFTSPLGKGCLRLIISAILSRGIQRYLNI